MSRFFENWRQLFRPSATFVATFSESRQITGRCRLAINIVLKRNNAGPDYRALWEGLGLNNVLKIVQLCPAQLGLFNVIVYEPYLIMLCVYQSEKLLSELDLMRQNYHSASEIKGLRMVLEESRTNGDRLHKESELVVQNVNTWVQEQK